MIFMQNPTLTVSLGQLPLVSPLCRRELSEEVVD